MVRYYKENEAVLPHSHSSSNSFVRQAIKRAREERGRNGREKGSNTIMFTNGRNDDECEERERDRKRKERFTLWFWFLHVDEFEVISTEYNFKWRMKRFLAPFSSLLSFQK